MQRLIILLFGLLSYAVFFMTFLGLLNSKWVKHRHAG
jgi:hypothetical protein